MREHCCVVAQDQVLVDVIVPTVCPVEHRQPDLVISCQHRV